MFSLFMIFVLLLLVIVLSFSKGYYHKNPHIAWSGEHCARQIHGDLARVRPTLRIFIPVAVFVNAIFLLAFYTIDTGMVALPLEGLTGFAFWMGWICADAIIYIAAFTHFHRAGNGGEMPAAGP